MDRGDRVHVRRGLLAVALALAAVGLAWSTLTYRPIAHICAWMYFTMVNGKIYQEPLRQVAAIPEIPAFLLTKLGGSANWTHEVLLLWSACYNLQPVVSLIVCWVICARARVTTAFLFPLFSFATATSMVLGVVRGEVVTALSVFWPLFLLQWVGKKGSHRSAGLVLGSIALVFTHHLSCLFFGVLAISAVLRKKENAFAILYGATALGIFAHGLSMDVKTRMFQQSIAAPWGTAWAAILATVALAIAIALESSKRFRGGFAWILGGAGLASVLVFAVIALRAPSVFASIDTSFHLRVVVLPLASLIALAALGAHRIHGKQWGALSWFTAVLLFQADVNDLVMTNRWITGVANLKKIVAAQDRPCSLISDFEYERDLKPFEMNNATLPIVSLLVQESRRPVTVVGIRQWTERRLEVDFCDEVSKGNLPVLKDKPLPLVRGGYLDFSALTSKLKG